MVRKTKDKTLEQWQIDDARRLRALCEKYLEKQCISQAALMAEMNLSQAMYFQLLGSAKQDPRRPLSLEHAGKFAKKLGVNVEQFSPELARQILDLYSMVENEEGAKIKER